MTDSVGQWERKDHIYRQAQQNRSGHIGLVPHYTGFWIEF